VAAGLEGALEYATDSGAVAEEDWRDQMIEAALVLKNRRHWGRIVAVVRVHLGVLLAVEDSEPCEVSIYLLMVTGCLPGGARI